MVLLSVSADHVFELVHMFADWTILRELNINCRNLDPDLLLNLAHVKSILAIIIVSRKF